MEQIDGRAPHRGCCYRECWGARERCVWHATVGEGVEKPHEEREAVRETAANRRLNSSSSGRHPAELLDAAQLSGLVFEGEPDFRGCSLRTADLSGAALSGADFTGAFLSDADLSNAELSGASFRNAELWKVDFSGADLTNADLADAYLKRGDLSGASLEGADLAEARIRGTRFDGVDLSTADLSGVDLQAADLTGASLATTYPEAADRLFRVVGDLRSDPPHGPSVVGEITGTDLLFYRAGRSKALFRATPDDHPLFRALELRTPYPSGTDGGKLSAEVEFVLLSLSPEAGISYRDVVARFGEPDVPLPPPSHGEHDPDRRSHRYDRSWGHLNVSFLGDELDSVAVSVSVPSRSSDGSIGTEDLTACPTCGEALTTFVAYSHLICPTCRLEQEDVVLEVEGRLVRVSGEGPIGPVLREALGELGAEEAAGSILGEHAKLETDGGRYYLTRVGEGELHVNEAAVGVGDRVQIADGDEIAFSGAVTALVRLGGGAPTDELF